MCRITPPENEHVPKKGPFSKEISSSNHQFSGDPGWTSHRQDPPDHSDQSSGDLLFPLEGDAVMSAGADLNARQKIWKKNICHSQKGMKLRQKNWGGNWKIEMTLECWIRYKLECGFLCFCWDAFWWEASILGCKTSPMARWFHLSGEVSYGTLRLGGTETNSSRIASSSICHSRFTKKMGGMMQ